MRTVFSSWLGLGLLGLGLYAACLPEVTIDDELGPAPETKTGSAQGTGGMAGTGPGAGKSGAAGAATTSSGGTSAAGSTSITEGVGGTEGGINLIDPSTAMGGAAGAGTPSAAGAGGTAATAGSGGTSAAAGASGAGDVCPDGLTKEQACNAYCALYSEACSDFPLAYDYQGPADCSLFCYDSDWEIGTISQPNSIMCRCNHANLALLRGQTPHCYHAARVPSMTGGCEIPPP